MNIFAATEDIEVLRRYIDRERQARKLAEQLLEDKSRELYRANEEIQQQYESLKTAQGQLVHSEKMASIGQLAAGVAHEINNPIGFVTSNVQTLGDYVTVFRDLLEDYADLQQAVREGRTADVATLMAQIDAVRESEDLDYVLDDTRDLLEESRSGLERVREIVQNLKSFVHLDRSRQLQADINEGLESTLKVVWNELKYKCRVEKNYGSLPLISCFAGELNQVFMNLLVNAAQAIADNGVIRITTEATDSEILVHISDNGCGIPAEVQSKLFTPFFTTKPVGKGTGLGLSVSYGIVRKHGGNIEVQSVPDEGTTFTVRLPVQPSSDVENCETFPEAGAKSREGAEHVVSR